jgi:hypothetical protein
VIQPVSALFKERSNKHDAVLPRYLAPKFDVVFPALGKIKKPRLLALAKILRLVQLLKHD